MNQVGLFNPFMAVAGNRLAAGMEAAAAQLAAGIMAQYFNPLGAGPLAFPSLPSMFDIGLFTPQGPQPQQWTASLGERGRGSIDLGDGYTLELNERNSEILITNSETGETTRIWGDPHVDFNGKRVFDFWGTTTFTLGNGTKITIETEQWGGNPDAYVASKVIITKGDQGIVVDGISQNQLGDLSISMGNNGRLLDATHRDGYTLHENMAGDSWLTEVGTRATQQHLDATRVGAQFGPGSTAMSLAELGQELTNWLMVGALFGSVSSATLARFGSDDRR